MAAASAAQLLLVLAAAAAAAAAAESECSGTPRAIESDDATATFFEIWINEAQKRVMMLTPAPNTALRAGSRGKQAMDLGQLFCFYADEKKTPVKQIGATGKKGKGWQDFSPYDIENGPFHDGYTILLTCPIPVAVFEGARAKREAEGGAAAAVKFDLFDLARPVQLQRIGVFTACWPQRPQAAPAPKPGYDFRVIACTSPTQLTAVKPAELQGQRVQEWLEWHAMLGIEQFYLYVDQWVTQQTRDALQPYVDSGLVTVIPWTLADPDLGNSLTEGLDNAPKHDHRWWSQRMPFARLQVTAHRHCMWKFGERAQWAFFFDMDEFLYPPSVQSEADVQAWVASDTLEPKAPSVELALLPSILRQYESNKDVCMIALHGPLYNVHAAPGALGSNISAPIMERCVIRSQEGTEDIKGGTKQKWFGPGGPQSLYCLAGVHASFCGQGRRALQEPAFSPQTLRMQHCRGSDRDRAAGAAIVEDPSSTVLVAPMLKRLRLRLKDKYPF